MLKNCPFLEGLSLWHTGVLDLKICSDTLTSLEYVEDEPGSTDIISAPSLTTLLYEGEGSLHLHHVPRLSNISFGVCYCEMSITKHCQDLSTISQLKVLHLEITGKTLRESVDFPTELSTLSKLEELEVKVDSMISCRTLLWLAVLVQAAPSLHTLTIKSGIGYDRIRGACSDEVMEKIERIVNATKKPHPKLRVIKCLDIYDPSPCFKKHFGRDCESYLLPMAKHMFENVAKSLEEVELTVVTVLKMPKSELISKWRPCLLGVGLPPVGVKLVIDESARSREHR